MRQQRVRLLLGAAMLGGLFAPWVAHRAAGLAFNLYDLYDLVIHLPPVESGSLHLQLQTLRFPFLVLALLLPWLLRRAAPGVRRVTFVVAAFLAVEVMPPYPIVLTAWRTPGWQVPFFWSVGTIIAAALIIWRGATLPDAIGHWALTGLMVVAFLAAVWSWFRLRPALSALYRAPIRPGWGMVLTGGSIALWLLLSGFEWARRERKVRHLDEVRRLRAREARRLMAYPGVVSVGVGEEEGEAVLVVGVRRAEDGAAIPRMIDGVPIRVEVIGTVRAR